MRNCCWPKCYLWLIHHASMEALTLYCRLFLRQMKKKQSNYTETMSTMWGYVCIFGQEICNVFPSLWTLPGCPLEWLDNALLYPCRSLLACPFPHIMSGKICSLAAEGRWVLLVNLLVMLFSLPEPAGLSWTKPCLHDSCLLRESVLCRVGTYVRARGAGLAQRLLGEWPLRLTQASTVCQALQFCMVVFSVIPAVPL